MSGIEEMKLRELEREAMDLMHKKLAPSQFCTIMGISADAAHDAVVRSWKRMKDRDGSAR